MRDSESVQALSTADIGRALHAVPLRYPASSVIPTLADSDFIRDAQQQERPSEQRQARRECERATARPDATADAIPAGAGHDHNDHDAAGKARGEVTLNSNPRPAFPSRAQIGGSVHPAPQAGGAAVPYSEREARVALARSVLPYAAQVQWGIAL